MSELLLIDPNWGEPCPDCGQPLGGSHYHCARCGGRSSMLGHHMSVHVGPAGKLVKVDPHFCCPGKCQLEAGASA